MASLQGLKRRLTEYRPHVQGAFVVYVTPRPSPVKAIDDTFDIVEVTDPDDPLLAQICAPWQLAHATRAINEGGWKIIVAVKDGIAAGRIWETWRTETSPFGGLPLCRLAEDECFLFDLYVEPEFRRSNVAMTMADYFFRRFARDDGWVDVNYVYGFVSYENAPSIMWHHAIGFNIVQTMNYLAFGPRVKWRIPFSDVPRFGPLSRHGRHTYPDVVLAGRPLFP